MQGKKFPTHCHPYFQSNKLTSSHSQHNEFHRLIQSVFCKIGQTVTYEQRNSPDHQIAQFDSIDEVARSPKLPQLDTTTYLGNNIGNNGRNRIPIRHCKTALHSLRSKQDERWKKSISHEDRYANQLVAEQDRKLPNSNPFFIINKLQRRKKTMQLLAQINKFYLHWTEE